MQYYREYVEVTDDPGGPFVAEIRLCHDFPVMPFTDQNRVVCFDDRVDITDSWSRADMPTDCWAALRC